MREAVEDDMAEHSKESKVRQPFVLKQQLTGHLHAIYGDQCDLATLSERFYRRVVLKENDMDLRGRSPWRRMM